ncbi:histidinol phosphate phosphatase [Desulfovibrio desulfuricans]|uniref:Histidinol-phosphatase n=1 Tax=Desulfovibrio desulfuricans TaxID=876 RepID=A0A4P7UNZ4_DESDE|nr:histidinol-phosphatase [Desulfovibrio desulfuricans]QCC86541.1 histidinol phosphate phosphatase [Desulfovibrio desulfuricans]
MICADIHNHTLASHGLASVGEMFAAAVARNLAWYGFSEHSPLPPGYSCPLYKGDLAVTFPVYAAEVQALREQTLGQPACCCGQSPALPRVLMGMELDWLPVNTPWMQNMVSRYPFDYIIGGLHFVDDLPVGSPRSWGPEVDQAQRFARYDAYYEAMFGLAGSGMVDVVAHPDFIKVCCYDDFQAWLSQPASEERIAAVLEAMRNSDTAMEISSAGLRKPFHEPYPGPVIMRLAADLGLSVSFGSDAHNTDDTGSHFGELAAYAAVYGFSRSRIFVGRERMDLAF